MSGLVRLVVLLAASYGLLYFSYKYYIPWSGGNDFANYYVMYQRPFDFSAASAPFVFRQLSAMLTHAVYAAGIYYPSEIWFHSPTHDQRIFFAALFTNYLCLIAAAWLSGHAVEILIRARSLVYPVLAGLLCFLSFGSQVCVITGLTEGLSWLLMAAGFVAYLLRRGTILGTLLLLAVIQRETIIVAFGAIAACVFAIDKAERRFNGWLFVWAVVCFTIYIAMRKFWGVEGHEGQVDPRGVVAVLKSFRLTREIIFQGLLSQNVLAIYACLCLASLRWMPEQRIWMPALVVTFAVLLVGGFAGGIGNNVGRICGILTPIFASFASVALLRIEEAVRAIPPQILDRSAAQPGAPADGRKKGSLLGSRKQF